MTELDDAIYRIASEINRLVLPGGRVPAPQLPEERVVDTTAIADDTRTEDA